MKVILNKDLAPLGEEGDIKDVARGYARNYLFPKNIAMPYTDRTVAILESRREAIEARKEEKRKDALGLKEKLEELDLLIAMPAGANGRLYGAVTSQTVAEELAKQGFDIERKRIELPGNSFKSVGKYKVQVRLYESAAAELAITVEGQQLKVDTPSSPARRGRRRDESPTEAGTPVEGAPAGAGADAEAALVVAEATAAVDTLAVAEADTATETAAEGAALVAETAAAVDTLTVADTAAAAETATESAEVVTETADGADTAAVADAETGEAPVETGAPESVSEEGAEEA